MAQLWLVTLDSPYDILSLWPLTSIPKLKGGNHFLLDHVVARRVFYVTGFAKTQNNHTRIEIQTGPLIADFMFLIIKVLNEYADARLIIHCSLLQPITKRLII